MKERETGRTCGKMEHMGSKNGGREQTKQQQELV